MLIPANLGPLLWGWPHRFVSRMHAADSEVILAGDYEAGVGTRGIEDPATFDARVPEHFDGYVWTNRIELIGPHLRKRGHVE
jgi:glycerophosphoryl diester phosphodiesterase